MLCHDSSSLQEGSEASCSEFFVRKLQALSLIGFGLCLIFSTLVCELFPEASRDQAILKCFIHSDSCITSPG